MTPILLLRKWRAGLQSLFHRKVDQRRLCHCTLLNVISIIWGPNIRAKAGASILNDGEREVSAQ
jgi:hypothetical protein